MTTDQSRISNLLLRRGGKAVMTWDWSGVETGLERRARRHGNNDYYAGIAANAADALISLRQKALFPSKSIAFSQSVSYRAA